MNYVGKPERSTQDRAQERETPRKYLLIEPTHNAHFQALMDRFMPHWRQIRNELNRLPLRHEDWKY